MYLRGSDPNFMVVLIDGMKVKLWTTYLILPMQNSLAFQPQVLARAAVYVPAFSNGLPHLVGAWYDDPICGRTGGVACAPQIGAFKAHRLFLLLGLYHPQCRCSCGEEEQVWEEGSLWWALW